MSEPVSNADIEDVLSSIRRLVSDEPTDGRSRRTAPEDASVERFVLTPALRVLEDDAPDAPDRSNPAEAVVPASAADQEPEPQISENFQSDTEWSDTEADTEADAVTPENAEPGTDPAPQPGPQPAAASGAAETMMDGSLQDRFAELEAAIEKAPQEWEPDGSEDGNSDETRPLSFEADTNVADFAHAMRPQADADDDAPQSSDQTGDTAELPADAVEDIAPAGPLISDAPDTSPVQDWQDVEADADDAQITELSAEFSTVREETVREEKADVENSGPADSGHADEMAADTAEAEIVAPEDDLSGDDEAGNILLDETATLDEDAVREMVSDLVRQELQGVLGERITRNVRRLVRREIQRAMAMRDLE